MGSFDWNTCTWWSLPLHRPARRSIDFCSHQISSSSSSFRSDCDHIDLLIVRFLLCRVKNSLLTFKKDPKQASRPLFLCSFFLFNAFFFEIDFLCEDHLIKTNARFSTSFFSFHSFCGVSIIRIGPWGWQNGNNGNITIIMITTMKSRLRITKLPF